MNKSKWGERMTRDKAIEVLDRKIEYSVSDIRTAEFLGAEALRRERLRGVRMEEKREEERRKNEILVRAVNTYGEMVQTVVCMEELAELCKALSKSIRGSADYQNIAEEMADVEIMLAQMKIIFSNADDVEAEKERKLNRLAERLKR